ncbi:MAG: hypothetical protein WBS33_02345 [Verrucomicrobiia bacterium]
MQRPCQVKGVAHVFNSLVARGESRESARHFVLQCVVAMFAEDIGLLRTICSPILQRAAIGLIFEAARENWSCVQPVIFGMLFEGSLGKGGTPRARRTGGS